MVGNDVSEGMLEERFVFYFEILFGHVPEGTEENHAYIQLRTFLLIKP
jgi:hypothetical protein